MTGAENGGFLIISRAAKATDKWQGRASTILFKVEFDEYSDFQ